MTKFIFKLKSIFNALFLFNSKVVPLFFFLKMNESLNLEKLFFIISPKF